MPATAERTLAVCAAKLRRMVALSETFQLARGIAGGTDEENAAAALEFVLMKSRLGKVKRPLAVVSMGEGFDWNLISGGDAYHLRPAGSLFLYLTIDTDAQYLEDVVSAEWTAWDFFSGILEEVAALSCDDDANSDFDESHLPIARMSVVGWGENPRETWNSDGRYYEAGILVGWGDD